MCYRGSEEPVSKAAVRIWTVEGGTDRCAHARGCPSKDERGVGLGCGQNGIGETVTIDVGERGPARKPSELREAARWQQGGGGRRVAADPRRAADIDVRKPAPAIGSTVLRGRARIAIVAHQEVAVTVAVDVARDQRGREAEHVVDAVQRVLSEPRRSRGDSRASSVKDV